MTDAFRLAHIFEDTAAWIKKEPVLSEAAASSAERTVLYKEGESPALPGNPQYETTVGLSHDRSFAAAMRLRAQFPEARIAVHNFASATNPGGGVTRGARAQEECLCRCSTLYPALDQERLWRAYYYFHRNRHDTRYTDAVIWTPDVKIIKTDEDAPVRMEPEDWCTVDVLTCAAPNLRTNPNNIMNPGSGAPAVMSGGELLSLHLSRGRALLTAAAANGDEVLVLGAFGCGAFRNDPDVVAKAYKQLMKEFHGQFRHVEFAVFTPKHNPENYFAFERAFGK